MKPASRRRCKGIVTVSTLGAMGLGMLAASLTGKEIIFRYRCLNTELAARPAPAEEGEIASELPAVAIASVASNR